MARRASRKDENQKQIEQRLSRVGVQFIDTSMLKRDTFDMIVMFRGKVWLVEVKNPDQLPKKFFNMSTEEQDEYLQGLLTDNETKTREKCLRANVPLLITWSADHLLRLIGGLPKPFGA